MSIEFHCSQCGRLLRTDDDTVGRMAQCPQCGGQTQVPEPATSTTPPSGAGGSHADSTGYKGPNQSAAAHSPGQGYPVDPLYALKRISAPAVCLIITAVLGLVAQTLGLLDTIFKIGMIPVFHQKEIMPMMFVGPIAITHSVIVIGLGIVVLIGAIKMKGLEYYWLGFTASILALIPCTSPCCCLGLPFGIWALVVLSDPLVKASFKS